MYELLQIPAFKDEYPISAKWFEAKGFAKGVVCVNSAGGVHQNFYQKYAAFLSKNNFHTLTWDARGIGLSRPKRLRGFQASFEDWAEKDFRGILNFLKNKNLNLHIVGHSIGGVYAGMLGYQEGISSMIAVASQAAYYKDWDKSIRNKLYFQWHILMPVLTKIFGYFPGKKLGLLEDIPAGIIKDWHERRKHPDLREQHKAKEKTPGYHLLKIPMWVVGIADDPIGTPQSMQRFLELFDNPNLKYTCITPSEIGVKKIGHFDFFRPQFEETLWQKTLLWLLKNT
ncbi:MAG: alpha/beta fold hydrolase [Raineya sp.]